jgi:hypothetical protein
MKVAKQIIPHRVEAILAETSALLREEAAMVTNPLRNGMPEGMEEVFILVTGVGKDRRDIPDR